MSTAAAAPRPRLGDFIRRRKAQIIADWSARVRSLPPASELSEPAVVDHLPEILDRVADMIMSAGTGTAVSLDNLPRLHAVDRLSRGFDLDQIVTEFSALRRCILSLWASEIGTAIDARELCDLDSAFDESMSESAERYAQAREKLLKGLDRVSEAALGSADLDVFLQQLVRVTVEGTESVDTCVVMIREGDTLRIRAAAGLEEDLRAGYALAIGEGFAGGVAAARRPEFVRHAAIDPRVKSEAIKNKGVRALYGVPLMREDKVIGVAHIGSFTAFEFSDEDKLLFRTMVSRATSGVVKAQILADLRRTETGQRFLAEASRQLAESLDYEATLAKIANLAVPTVADWCVVDLRENDAIRRVSVAHTDATKNEIAFELGERYPVDPNDATGVANVIRTGVTEWRAEITDAELRAAARDEAHVALLRALGLKSYIIAPMLARGEVLGTIALVTAESKRRYSESDVQLAEDLARRAGTAVDNGRLYAQAQGAVAVRDRVLAIVSHDLRNQLGVIRMGAHLLGRKLETLSHNADLMRPIDTIRRVSDSMQHLVGDLVDMASLQAGKLSVTLQPLAIDPVLEEACRRHELIASAKHIALVALLSARDARVMADRDRILQVLGNLLGNAVKFTPSGGTITVRSSVGDRDVQIEVSDTGTGIAAQDLETIFEPYRSIERQAGGAGLGLYITRGIIERHSGRVWVESRVGAGTTFFLTLPRVS